jgi:hypothetical protein
MFEIARPSDPLEFSSRCDDVELAAKRQGCRIAARKAQIWNHSNYRSTRPDPSGDACGNCTGAAADVGYAAARAQ